MQMDFASRFAAPDTSAGVIVQARQRFLCAVIKLGNRTRDHGD